MAIGTGGTTATTTLTALRHPGSFIRPDGTVYPPSGGPPTGVETDADIATVNQAIKDDQNFNQPSPGGGGMWGYSRNGVLYVPNRGFLRVLAGDCVMVDSNGWPILVSARSFGTGAGPPWVSTAT